MSIELESYFKARQDLIEKELDQSLPSEKAYPEKIHQAIRYSLFSGGKRVRPILLLAGFEVLRDDLERALPFACAIEMIHNYSLIHDDLPAMDDDDFRRGKPTCHKVFGEATAILAGDALLTEAFGLMAKTGLERGMGMTALRAIREVAEASGLAGIITGQELDLDKQGQTYDEQDLLFINQHKTAALIRAAVVAGGILGEAGEKELDALSGFAEKIGIAFQIVDDLLDFQTGDGGRKGEGSDARKKKATYPGLIGLNRSKEIAERLSREAINCLEIFPERAEPLRKIAGWLVSRGY